MRVFRPLVALDVTVIVVVTSRLIHDCSLRFTERDVAKLAVRGSLPLVLLSFGLLNAKPIDLVLERFLVWCLRGDP